MLDVNHVHFHCSHGNPIRTLYSPLFRSEDRAVHLEVTGSINLFDSIQASAELTDISVLLQRFAAGDESVLNQRVSMFGDTTVFHGKSIRDLIENQRMIEDFYNNLSDADKSANGVNNINEFFNKVLSGGFDVPDPDPDPVPDPDPEPSPSK